MPRNSALTHETILTAAHDVLRSHGVRALTLDKVAKQAGVSKGGLIHHFPTREALLLAMQDHGFKLAYEQMEFQLQKEAPGPGRFLRAYLNCNLTFISQGMPSFFLGIAELAIAEPDIFRTKRDFMQQIQSQIEDDGIEPVLASIIAGASDNLWLQVLFGMIDANDPQIQRVHDRLIEMTRQQKNA